MNKLTINQFKGWYTEYSATENPGATTLLNVDLDKKISKALGHEITNSDQIVAVSSLLISSMTASIANIKFFVASASDYFASGDIVGIPELTESTDVSTITTGLSNSYIAIDNVTASCFTYEYNYASFGADYTGTTAYNVYKGIAKIKGFTDSIVKFSNVECQGTYYDNITEDVYTFLSNKSSSASYMITSDRDTCSFGFVEPVTTCASATAFGTTYNAEFVKYNNDIIFTKNEKRQIQMDTASGYGGVLYLNASGIQLYGATNNPTGSTIEVYKERIWVGDISYEGNTQVDGGSWIISSKEYPETKDTEFAISAITFASATTTSDYQETASMTVTGHTFKIGQYIMVDSVVLSAGANDINGKMYEIKGAGTNYIVIYLPTKGHAYTSGGTAILRGNNWLPSTSLYLPSSTQAGILKCDDNDTDHIVKLKKSFTSLIILRKQNPYILTESSFLAQQLNIEYGTVSKSVAQTANGFYFVSEYGLAKVTGTKIEEKANSLDNIIAYLPTEKILSAFEGINTKANIRLNFNNTYIWLHDKDSTYTYVLDTRSDEWTRYYGILADDFFTDEDEIYSVYKGFIFQNNKGYTKFRFNDFADVAYNSNYVTRIVDFGSELVKEFVKFYTLLEGSYGTDATIPLQFNLYYDGKIASSKNMSFDIKTGNDITWIELASSTEIWTDVFSITDTWESVLGRTVSVIERGDRFLGFGKQLMFEIVHTNANWFAVNEFSLYYNILDIDRFNA